MLLPAVGRREKPKLEAHSYTTDSIALALTPKLFLAFLAQKSLVKSQNHLNHCPPSTYNLKFSYAQSAIINL